MNLETDTLILEALTKLAIARGAVPDGEQNDVYLDSLAPYDPALIQRVCFALRTQPRQDYETALPSVGTLITLVQELAQSDAQAASQKLLGAMPRKSYDEPTFYCLVCFDGFWEQGWCPGSGAQRIDLADRPARYDGCTIERCERDKPHGPHGWARKCQCVERNPVIHRQRERHRAAVGTKTARGAAREGA